MTPLLATLALVGAAALSAVWVLRAQGRAVRSGAPSLPEAPPPHEGQVAAPGPSRRGPLRLLVLGDSVAAGVGAGHHERGLPGSVAKPLASRLMRDVQWRAVGRIGATSRRVRFQLATIATLAQPEWGFARGFKPDVVLLVVGVNDATALRGAAAYARELAALIAELRGGRGGHRPHVLIAGVPPMNRFPALPQPLRGFLGWRARCLDRAASRLSARLPAVQHVPTPVGEPADFAPDGYHPGPRAYATWGERLAEVLVGPASRLG